MHLSTDERITVDGALEERAWERAEAITNFKQSEPRNGEPGTERTQIRILFSEDNLYIGAQFFDSDPRGILGNQMVRDGSLNADDRFMMVLDPINDRRSGYFFEMNPAGAMGDAQLVPANAGSGLTQNRAWNGIWLARTRRTDQGWSVEVEIPFRTMNFNPDTTEWGANFQRTVRRKNEENFWSGWARNQGLFSLITGGRIVGITGVSQGHGIDIKPYVLGTYLQPRPGSSSVYTGSEGLDVFYNPTPLLRANLTVNTDFAQTEVDDRQVNLTRFPLFFPEKRDFFLESSGNFDFSRESNQDMTAFFSRRIGLNDKGQPQDIDYGAKLAGTAGPLNVGFMQVRTGDQGSTPGEDFTIIRPKKQFLRQSYAGVIYTRRASRDSAVPDRQTIGTDFQLTTNKFRGSENLDFNGYFLRTPDGTGRGDDKGFGFRLLYPNDRWSGRLVAKEMQKNFDPAIGFRQRADNREYGARWKFAPRPKNSRIIRQSGAEVWYDWFSDTRGVWEEKNNSFIFDVDFQSGDSATFTINPVYEHLPEPFKIATGITLPKGANYDYTRYAFKVDTTNRRKIALSGNMSLGTFYDGHRKDLGGSIILRPRRGLLFQLTGQVNQIDLVAGSFDTKLIRALVNTQFNPFISVSNNIQYDSVSGIVGWQSRFRWITKPGNDMYFVWMTNWQDLDDRFAMLDRNAAIKLLYTYRP